MLTRDAVSSIEIVIFKRYLTISDSIFQPGLRDKKEVKITVRDESPYFVEFRDCLEQIHLGLTALYLGLNYPLRQCELSWNCYSLFDLQTNTPYSAMIQGLF